MQNPKPGTQNSAHHLPPVGRDSFPGWTTGFEAALDRLSIAARLPARSQHPGGVRSRTRGRALEFADYRPYSPGDDPKLVDWRAYARLGRLYLKQSEEERTRTVTLLVDASGSLDWGEGEEHKGLYARRLAAALAWIGLSHHEPVRVCVLRDGVSSPLPPVSTRSKTALLFRQLAAVKEGGSTGLAPAVGLALRGALPGPVFLLSDLLDPGWLEALQGLARAGEAAVLQLLAPSEWEPPLGEEVELQDAETGELRPTRLGPIELAAYGERLDAFVADVRHHCHRLGLIHVPLNTGTPLRETVLRQLPAAGVLSG